MTSPDHPLLAGEQPPREQHGFARTRCPCEFCRVYCRHIPGTLDVADLTRLCPADQDVFAWAELHLRALTDKSSPTLVPARRSNGHCHWLVQGLCAVHADAPFGCAFFDAHMDDAEVERRRAATVEARNRDARENGLYYRVWQQLCRKGLTAPSGDREAVAVEMRRIQQEPERRRRRRGE